MKLKTNTLAVLAEMICGNEPYNAYMPYRSSSLLTKFFRALDLPYVHDGSTRDSWVSSVLEKLNTGDISSSYPSEDLARVVLHIVDPDHFLAREGYDQAKAVEKLNQALRSSGLRIDTDPLTNIPSLVIADEVFASSAVRRADVKSVITFVPNVFQLPKRKPQSDLVAIMMDFGAGFNAVHLAIKAAVESVGLISERADDVWRDSVIVQDIFELVYAAHAVVVDFTGKNPNVMYETGIAHTLGKIVIPISQHIDDVPFDLRHHRALIYLSNAEGLGKLKQDLQKRLDTVFNLR